MYCIKNKHKKAIVRGSHSQDTTSSRGDPSGHALHQRCLRTSKAGLEHRPRLRPLRQAQRMLLPHLLQLLLQRLGQAEGGLAITICESCAIWKKMDVIHFCPHEPPRAISS